MEPTSATILPAPAMTHPTAAAAPITMPATLPKALRLPAANDSRATSFVPVSQIGDSSGCVGFRAESNARFSDGCVM
ncbi:hypothetical protein [Bifidobacterium miconisargentati]|uniref:hypothetical protein n=1 Tax=Bifidobacterium miconisargentati TaxID=2834437 RepID=UPI001BDC27FA|nr:hypothetical protein [Bifidobacterium miconisargentati]MBW3091287.1 hypothetical protein [Bifidobacterium miconisargentati]